MEMIGKDDPLPSRIKDLQQYLDDLYIEYLKPGRGKPDYGQVDPIKGRIEQVKTKIERIQRRKQWVWSIVSFVTGLLVARLPDLVSWL